MEESGVLKDTFILLNPTYFGRFREAEVIPDCDLNLPPFGGFGALAALTRS